MHEQSRRIYDTGGVSPTIHTMGGGNTEVKVAILKQNVSEDTSKPRALGHIPYPGSDKPHQSNTFYDSKAVSPTLDTCEGGNRQVKILVEKEVDSQNINVIGNYMPSNHDASRIVHPGGVAPTVKENHGTVTATIEKVHRPLALDEQNQYIRTDGTVGTIMTDGSSPKHNNRVIEPDKRVIIGGMQKHQAVKKDGVCTTLTSSMGTGGGYVPMHNYTTDYRIRKLTPKECWRLMGFDDEDFEKAQKVNSNTQLYKQAGNSIVVDVLEGILGALLNLKTERI